MSNGDLDARMKAMFEGNFLDASDIKGMNVEVEISSVVAPNDEKDATGKVIDKAILSFNGKQKRFICGKTNAKAIRMLHGQKASEWVGKKIVLMVRYLECVGRERNLPVIRVKVPQDMLTMKMRKWYGSEKPFDK